MDVYTHVHTKYLHMYVIMYICIHTYVFSYVSYIFMSNHTFIDLNTYARTFIHMYVCTCAIHFYVYVLPINRYVINIYKCLLRVCVCCCIYKYTYRHVCIT